MNKFKKQLKSQIKNGEWTGYVTYYPHKRAYRDIENLDLKKAWQDVDMLNIYVHIPFCEHKCTYCNLFSTVLPKVNMKSCLEKYVDKVLEEIEYNSQFIKKDAKIMTIYFGGGTPNILPVQSLIKILKAITSHFPNLDDDIEICTECSPELITLDYLKQLKSGGFDRISVGVQTLNENETKKINRYSNYDMIKNIRSWAKQCNLHINFDLIYGLPHQTPKSFFDSLNKIIALGPESICTYPLAIRKYTKMYNENKNNMLTMKQKYHLFKKIRKHLEKNGYEIETIVRFVKKETKNKSTCQMEKYEYAGICTLGFGAGARSYAKSVNYCITYKVQDKFVKDIIEKYMNTPSAERKFTGYFYKPFDHKIKYAMLNLLDSGVNIKTYNDIFKTNFIDDFNLQTQALKGLKMIYFDKKTTTFKLTRKGMQYCDLVANTFISDEVKQLYSSYVEG